MTDWSYKSARDAYLVSQWSDGFFDISKAGHMQAYPKGRDNNIKIDLVDLAKSIKEAGLAFPVLVRFTDIIQKRIQTLSGAFMRAIKENEYKGSFTCVYPIKVNQQRRVVEAILDNTDTRVGLETGSKPELLATLALSAQPESVIVCNGYKDREYIKLALIGQRLGHRVCIILEKLSELPIVLEEAKKMGLEPCIGIRVRLASVGNGKWSNTSGEKAKFGFSAPQVLRVVEILREKNQLHLLKAMHFNLGSQIANIADIQCGMRECARYFAALNSLGAPINIVDVGGGLAVDYEGTRSRSEGSMNYSVQEYANNIVYILAEICQQHNLPHPEIITESGRALTAHHAMLITNVIATESACDLSNLSSPEKDDAAIIKNLWEDYTSLSESSALEAYHDVCLWNSEAQTMFTHGLLDLQKRAYAEQIYYATLFKVRDFLKPSIRAHREVIDELHEKLADKFFCNFSLFQSLPDAWAIDQVFPIIPLSGLDKLPTQRGILHDITCDSDGRIDHYVNNFGLDSTLSLLPHVPNEEYLLGIFMVGAYQEILGDLHNLFGDTHSVQVELKEDGGYKLAQAIEGDTVESALGNVNFNRSHLIRSYREQLEKSGLS
ncbi:biosynthetic arginine decarboxylase, partial [Gammaproteobacteria bacterium]|nr:biosynthetic arginine decarboxylase [Gammaproteobacteria bacterium]